MIGSSQRRGPAATSSGKYAKNIKFTRAVARPLPSAVEYPVVALSDERVVVYLPWKRIEELGGVVLIEKVFKAFVETR